MNEATKQALEQFVTKMLSAAEQGATWTAEQAPLVVQEWLRWQVVNCALWSAVFVALTVYVALRMLPWARKKRVDEIEFAGAWGIYLAIQSIVFLIGALWVEALLKVTLAPRVVVLEKFMELVK